MTLSTYAANAVNDHLSGKAAIFALPVPYIALMTAAATVAGGGTEASYTGYARVAFAGSFGTSVGGTKANTAAITYPACTGGSAQTVVQFAIWDSATPGTGNLLEFGTCSLTISSGITPQFPIGALTLSET